MITNIIKSRWFVGSISIIVGLILILMAFWFGMYVGERRADFARGWGDNYGRIFGQPRMGFFPEPGENPVPRGFGNGGVVLKVEGNAIAIKGNDNVEKTVVVATSTPIREGMTSISVDKINPGDSIVIIGDPNSSGQIQARFIRVFPSNINSSSTQFQSMMGGGMMENSSGTLSQ